MNKIRTVFFLMNASRLRARLFILFALLIFSASAKASCEYTFTGNNFFYQAEITFVNDGPVALTAWDVSFTFPSGDSTSPTVANIVNGNFDETLSNSGSTFTVEIVQGQGGGQSGILSVGESIVLQVQNGPTGGGQTIEDPPGLTGILCDVPVNSTVDLDCDAGSPNMTGVIPISANGSSVTDILNVTNAPVGSEITFSYAATNGGTRTIGATSIDATTVPAVPVPLNSNGATGSQISTVTGGPDFSYSVELIPISNGNRNATWQASCVVPPPSSLTLIKDVVNNDGGTLDASSWTLNAGANAVAGSAVGMVATTAAGTYALSESTVAGYTNTSITCDNVAGEVTDVTVAQGEDVTCTFVNDDDAPPNLSVTKVTSTVPDFAGNTASYSIVVSNASGADATNVVVTDTPENIAFTYASSTITLNGGATQPTSVTPVTGANPMSWSAFTIPAGANVEIEVTMDVAATLAAGVYNNSVDLSASNTGVSISNYDGSSASNSADDVVIHQSSPLAGSLVINEVMYRATGSGAAGNDEFIELYNAGTTSIDLAGLMLIDGNKVTNDLDGTAGSITGNTMSFEFACTGVQICSGPTVLAPGDYAVIWVGTQDLTSKNASDATFQAWLGQTQKLNNGADDLWLFGVNNEFIDYIAWGSVNSAGVNSDYPVGVWDTAVQATLDGVPAGASISLTPNGIDSDDSNCWEETTSADSSTRCTGYLATIDTDTVGTRVTSVGSNNNGGTIIIQKQTLPDGSTQVFDFSGDITASLTDGASSVPLTVSAGTYTVTESVTANWVLASIVCNDTDSSGDITSLTATFSVAAGETVTCVFTNQQTANLTLEKVVNNTIGGGSASASDWTLEGNINGGTAEISGLSGVSMDVVAGDYLLSELNGPSAYVLESLTCDVGNLDPSTNTLTLAPGENSICTFTNRDLITDLQITKTVSDQNPIVGAPVTFELLVVNNGPDDATNVTINDTILSGFTFVANSMTGGGAPGDTQNQTAPDLIWTINALPAGAANAVTLTYQATVN